MELKEQLEDRIFDIYFLGGATCILGEYTERATRILIL